MGTTRTVRYYKRTGQDQYQPHSTSKRDMERVMAQRRQDGLLEWWCADCGAVVNLTEAGQCPWHPGSGGRT